MRLGMGHRITADITPPILYHAVSQGALAVEIRSDDAEAQRLCDALTHRETEWKCVAERALLRELEGGCSVPVGVDSALIDVATTTTEGGLSRATLRLTGCVTSIDGTTHVQDTIEERISDAEQATAVGVRLAHVLMDKGAKAILEDITKDRERRATAHDEKREG